MSRSLSLWPCRSLSLSKGRYTDPLQDSRSRFSAGSGLSSQSLKVFRVSSPTHAIRQYRPYIHRSIGLNQRQLRRRFIVPCSVVTRVSAGTMAVRIWQDVLWVWTTSKGCFRRNRANAGSNNGLDIAANPFPSAWTGMPFFSSSSTSGVRVPSNSRTSTSSPSA